MPISARSDKCDESGCNLSSDVNIDFEVDFVARKYETGPRIVQLFFSVAALD